MGVDWSYINESILLTGSYYSDATSTDGVPLIVLCNHSSAMTLGTNKHLI